MMNTIIKENCITFKELEKNIFQKICQIGRNIYEVRSGDHTRKYTYLLDEALQLENTGLISANLAEQLVSGITEMSYRECAKKISSMTGQSISTMGVRDTHIP